MNVFFHGTIEAGFEAVKSRIEGHMAGEVDNQVSEWRIADPSNGEVMCVMNVTDMGSFGAFMNSREEAQWDKDNGAVFKAYMMQKMEG